jgi:asparagine synthase (glutamine-hydrolysing)
MRYRVEQPGDKLHKLSGVIDSPDEFALYLRLLKQWRDPQSILIQQEIPTAEKSERSSNGLVPFMMQHDLTHYLPDDILVKVDRASMAVALESRAPFLDHRVVECAWRLPIDVRIQNGVSKWPLRQILSHYVPLELIDRPKMGFGVPLGVWLRGPLREWAESLLDEKRIRQEGIFRPEPIRAAWLHHLSGKQNLQHKLWCILMFQAWKEKWLP